MTTTLTVPASIEEIVLRYDAKEGPFTEFDIGGELKRCAQRLDRSLRT